MTPAAPRSVDHGPFRLDEATRARWAREFRSALEDLLDAWFPRVVDREHGGFLCDFDYRWRPTGPHHKMLEFQSRQTRFAATAAAFLPERADLRAAAEHGFSFLRDAMWDDEYGGFYRLLDRAGRPLERGTKHGHGMSYTLTACVAHHRLTGSDEPLDLAKRGFAWLEEHAHDPRHGGYFSYYQRDGRLILDREQSLPEYRVRDPIGTPLGYKDMNTTKDLLETVTHLQGVWPDELVRERLREMLHLVCHRAVVPPGSTHQLFNPDWTPIPDFANYGQNVHCASVLLHAATSLGAADQEMAATTSRALLDCALEYAWSASGGLAQAGSTFGKANVEDVVLFVDRKYWWTQAEALASLVHFALREGPGLYADRAAALWRYIQTNMVDDRHGGWFRIGRDAGKAFRKLPKADLWKDACHEGLALIKCVQMLENHG